MLSNNNYSVIFLFIIKCFIYQEMFVFSVNYYSNKIKYFHSYNFAYS